MEERGCPRARASWSSILGGQPSTPSSAQVVPGLLRERSDQRAPPGSMLEDAQARASMWHFKGGNTVDWRREERENRHPEGVQMHGKDSPSREQSFQSAQPPRLVCRSA